MTAASPTDADVSVVIPNWNGRRWLCGCLASVDAQTRADLEDLVRTVRAQFGMTMLLVTHDIDEAVYLADRVVVLSPSPCSVLSQIAVFFSKMAVVTFGGAYAVLAYVAQEAVHNAIEHGKATQISIGLSAGEDEGVLTIMDNGCGIPEVRANQTGIGLRIMKYRAGMIGGTLRVERGAHQGTLISCTFSIKKRAER